jgi:hypothetical protein
MAETIKIIEEVILVTVHSCSCCSQVRFLRDRFSQVGLSQVGFRKVKPSDCSHKRRRLKRSKNFQLFVQKGLLVGNRLRVGGGRSASGIE